MRKISINISLSRQINTALFVTWVFISMIMASSFNTYANDKIKIWKPVLNTDKRALHKDEVIRRALEITVPKFGEFSIEAVHVDMNPGRALEETKSGKILNLFISPHSTVWNEGTIPIKVPIRHGLLSYRLLLIRKQDLAMFEKVKTLDDLKRLTAGLHSDWMITKIFQEQGFKVNRGHSFEGLFQMLEKQRFDYFPRAIYEIYNELETRKSSLENVVIEPTLAIYLPTETYVYVSPTAPRIADRMQQGLNMLLKSGELKRILVKYYSDEIARANLANRKIIKIENSQIKNPVSFGPEFILHNEVVE